MLRKNGFSSVLTLFIFVADQINDTMISDKKIKKHINRKRLSMGLTQSEMAARLKIDRNTYRNIEKGKTRMLNEHLNDIASILEAETDELILGYLPGDPENDPILREKTLEYDNKTASMAASYSRKIEEDRITIQLLNKKIEDLQESLRDKTDLISFQKEKIAEYEKLLGKM
jgi:transcriptional regulator with XRE-family HTH domain